MAFPAVARGSRYLVDFAAPGSPAPLEKSDNFQFIGSFDHKGGGK